MRFATVLPEEGSAIRVGNIWYFWVKGFWVHENFFRDEHADPQVVAILPAADQVVFHPDCLQFPSIPNFEKRVHAFQSCLTAGWHPGEGFVQHKAFQ